MRSKSIQVDSICCQSRWHRVPTYVWHLSTHTHTLRYRNQVSFLIEPFYAKYDRNLHRKVWERRRRREVTETETGKSKRGSGSVAERSLPVGIRCEESQSYAVCLSSISIPESLLFIPMNSWGTLVEDQWESGGNFMNIIYYICVEVFICKTLRTILKDLI